MHGFKNKSDKIAHLICMVVPAGLEEMFLEMGQPVKSGEFLPPPPMDPETAKKMTAIAEKYGQKLFPPDYLDKHYFSYLSLPPQSPRKTAALTEDQKYGRLPSLRRY